jgi:PAS domain S-box-containing protein
MWLVVCLVLAVGLGSVGWLAAHRYRRQLAAVRSEAADREACLTWVMSNAKVIAWQIDPVTWEMTPNILGDIVYEKATERLFTTPFKDFMPFVHAEDAAKLQQTIAALRARGEPFNVEYRVMGVDGSTEHVHTSAAVVRDDAGRVIRVYGMACDVTSTRRAEAELHRAEERLARAVRAGTHGLFEVDFVSGEFWTDSARMLHLGYAEGEIAQTAAGLDSLMHPDDIPVRNAAFFGHLEGKTPRYEADFRMKAKNGEWMWFNAQGQAERSATGKPLRICGIVQDITEKKKYQQALLEATSVAAAANRAKGEFLANMSHEIRTPMNGVIGMSGLLLDTQLDSTQRDYAETIRDSGAALLTVINDILDFSKIEAGKLDLEALDLDLRDTLEDVARLLAVQAHPKGLEVTAQVDPTLPDLVKGDPGRFRQVLLNLGTNGVKFTKQGEVSIELKVIESDAENVLVRCEVRDTGMGIPKDRVQALFQPFVQVDASTTRQFGGTGLGLSIVRRLVDLMGGTTGVESEEGVGSTFWFTARLGVATQNVVAPQLHSTALAGRRVLVVDDNATNRKVVTGQLTLCGIQAECVSSAAEGLQALVDAHTQGRPFEIALLDYQMPDCDGAELGRQIKADSRLSATRLIALTSSGQRGDGQKFAEIGFVGYLLKPITQRDLTGCLMLVFAPRVETEAPVLITRHELRAQRARTRVRILLAEDNPVNQKVASRVLEKLGYRVDVVVNGKEALTAWGTGRYDVILMDCQMPEMDGYEATRQIRMQEASTRSELHIPIIALTAHAMKGADEECRAAGMDGYLTKPLDRALLETTIKRYTEESPSVP